MKTSILLGAALVGGGLATPDYFEHGKVCRPQQVTVTTTVWHTSYEGKTADPVEHGHGYPHTTKGWADGAYGAWLSISAHAWPWAAASAPAGGSYGHGQKPGVTSPAEGGYGQPGYGYDGHDGYDGYEGHDGYGGHGGYGGESDGGYGGESGEGSDSPSGGSLVSSRGGPVASSRGAGGDPAIGSTSSLAPSSARFSHDVSALPAASSGFPSASRHANSSSTASSSSLVDPILSSRSSTSLLSSLSSLSSSLASASSSSHSSSFSSIHFSNSSSSVIASSSSSSVVVPSDVLPSGVIPSTSSSSLVSSSSSSSLVSSSSSSSSLSSHSSTITSSSSSSSSHSSSSSSSSSFSSHSSSSSRACVSPAPSCAPATCASVTNAHIGPTATGVPSLSCGDYDDAIGVIDPATLSFPVKIYDVVSSNIFVSSNGFITLDGSSSSGSGERDLPATTFADYAALLPYWQDWETGTRGECGLPYGVYYYADAESFGIEYFTNYYNAGGTEITRVQFSAQTYAATPGVWTFKYYVVPDRAVVIAARQGSDPGINKIGAQRTQTGPFVQVPEADAVAVAAGTVIVCDTNVTPATCTVTPNGFCPYF